MNGIIAAAHRRILAGAAVLFLTMPWSLPAQSPAGAQNPATEKPAAAPAEAEQTPTIRTNVDEVSLDVVAHDKGKHLILDLKPEDLNVTDNGTPVKLTGLRLVHGDSTRRHLITFLFDPFTGPTAKSAHNAADKVLKAIPTNGYTISVLDVRGRLRLIQGFTDDRKAVDAAIETATASKPTRLDSTMTKDVSIVTEGAEPARTKAIAEAEKNLLAEVNTGADSAGKRLDVTDRSYARALFSALQESQKSLQDKHGYLNLGGLQALIHAQQKLTERKAIVYFTHNMAFDSAAKAALKAITADSTRAGVTIYTVDLDAMNQAGQTEMVNATLNAKRPYDAVPVVSNPHGDTTVVMQQEGGFGIQGDPSPTGPQWTSKQDVQMATDFSRQGPALSWGDTKNPMAHLSTDTGGIYIDAEGNMKKLLGQMVEDMGTYYEATYTPPVKEYDGSFRTIGVTSVRKGIAVKSKTGYYAVAPGTDESLRPFEVPLVAALAQPTLASEIKFRTSVLRFGELPDGNTNTFALEIPYSALQVKEDARTNLFSTQVAVYAEIKDAAGTLVERFGDNITKRGALETLDRDSTAALTFERHFTAMPGKYTLSVAVADQLGGKTGAERVSFEIPKTADSLALSDLVLVRRMNKVQAEEEDALNPLRYEQDRITPDISGQLAAGAKGVSLFFMLHPDAAAKDSPTLEVEVSRNGDAGRRIPLPLTHEGDQAVIPYLASFGSGAMAQGHYLVKAYLTQGGKTAEQSLEFNVGNGTTVASANVDGKSSDTGVTAIAAPPEVNVPGQLSIIAVKNPVAPLSVQDGNLLIEDARARAVSYTDSLPNFMCLEVINRSVDPTAMGNWKLKDTIVELLRYREKQETRTTLEVNGEKSNVDFEAMKGPLSVGEFGGVLKSVFATTSQAAFQWKETDELNGGAVQVFDYSVEQPHSKFTVVGTDGRQIFVGFHGKVFIDSTTRSVRRVTLIADVPAKFSIRASSIRVDYDYVGINDHDYLVPVSAEMRLTKGKHDTALNTIEFRNYKKFGSNMRVVGFTPIDEQKPEPKK